MHCVAEGLAYLFADVLSQSDYETGSPHPYNLSAVWHSVESGIYRQPSFAEKGFLT